MMFMRSSSTLPTLPLVLLAAFALLVPGQARAQTIFDLLASVRQGGGWVNIPIEDGRGSVRTPALPTAGLELTGCVRVWPGHTGRWELEAHDTRGGGSLRARSVAADEPVPFVYETGSWAQLDVRVRWSEPRDTTLVLWIGLERRGSARADPCEPVYRSGSEER
jgi:hypothetical protein